MHTALFYSGEDDYVEGLRRFVAGAAETASPVLIAVPAARLELLRRELDADRAGIKLVDLSGLGANPARIIPAIRGALDAHPGRPLHFVAEPVWADRAEEEIREAMRHEALVNLAFASACVEILCPYEIATLDQTVVVDAECTHPRVWDAGGERRSLAYAGWSLPARCEALGAPPADAATMRFGVPELPALRALVREHAEEAGLDSRRSVDVVLAADEIATNAIRYGGGCGLLRLWRRDHGLTCQIDDDGHIRDPLAGRVRPAAGATRGRGLWLVNQLCDLVEIRTGAAGTAVRMHATAAPANGGPPEAAAAGQRTELRAALAV